MKQSLKSEFLKLKNKKPQSSTNKQTKYQVKQVKQVEKKQTKNIKTKKTQKRSADNMFDKFTFCFPYLDIHLTKKQIDIITKTIQQRRGKVVQFNDKLQMQPVSYVLVSPLVRIQNVIKKIQNKLNYVDILDYNFIECCIAQGNTIQTNGFSLLRSNQQQKMQQKPDYKLQKKKKKIQQKQQQSVQSHSLTQKLGSSQQQEISLSPQSRVLPDKSKFFCQVGKDESKPSMNKFIQKQLLELQKIYANQRDVGRRIAYGKAASLVRMFKEQIKTKQDVDKIQGIGPKINQKIKEIVQTGKLKKLQQLNQSEQVVAMGQLSKVWGVGPAKAKQLYKQGIKSIQELRKNQQSLTRNQKIGLKYFQDFQKRIPRQKITRMFQVVQKTIQQISKTPQAYKSQVCGSYRRGKSTCGDMDIIISRKDGIYQKDLLQRLVSQLHKKKFLTDNLSQPKSTQTHTSTSYMGVCVFQDQTHLRIDIKHYPLEEYAFAVLYFTGSGMFNRSMRLFANGVGLLLSDKGFSRRPGKNDIQWTKDIPTCYNQQDVFNVLGLDYKTPAQRDD